VGNVGSLRVEARAERQLLKPPGLPGRIKSLFSAGAWARRPEPRVRYGQPLLPGLASFGRQYLADAEPLLERAEATRGRRFTYLGRTVGFPGRIDWEPAGLSAAWHAELAALDEVVALGIAATLALNADLRRSWFDLAMGLVREWESGAPRNGVGWQLGALARRIPNLIHTYVLFGPELRADPRQRGTILESLYAQSEALAAAVPGQPADRRLVDAGRALFFAGRFFDGMEARGWLEAGTAILWAQLREQVNDDGGHVSRNPAEHARVLASYLEVLAFLQTSHDEVPIWARKRVKGMADFFVRMLHPDGEIPLFHGAALGVARPARELLAVAAVVLHEAGLAPPGELPGVWAHLLLGEAGRRVHGNLPRRRQAVEPRALRRTGFYVLPGDPGDVMLLDGESPAAGGHANVFGYELSVAGARLVVSGGTNGEEPGPWSEYVASTRAHNVVAVNDAEQLATGRLPVVSETQWVVRDGLLYWSGVHDAFARLALDLRLRHRRRVFCLPGRFWLVCDEILGNGDARAESFVHFHPDVAVQATCQGAPAFHVARSEAARLQVVTAGGGEVALVHGVEAPRPQGWYAPRPGVRRPSPVLSIGRAARLPFALAYAMLPRVDEPAALDLEHDAFRLHATLRSGGLEYRLTVVQGEVEMQIRTA
jgi:heparinase II/III-like protein